MYNKLSYYIKNIYNLLSLYIVFIQCSYEVYLYVYFDITCTYTYVRTDY